MFVLDKIQEAIYGDVSDDNMVASLLGRLVLGGQVCNLPNTLSLKFFISFLDAYFLLGQAAKPMSCLSKQQSRCLAWASGKADFLMGLVSNLPSQCTIAKQLRLYKSIDYKKERIHMLFIGIKI